MTTTGRLSRQTAIGLAAVLTATLSGIGAAPAAAQAPVWAKADAEVRSQLSGGATATFWVVLKESELPATAGQHKAARTESVYRAKTERAERTQRGLRGLLEAKKAEHTPYWISNRIQVTGDAELLAEIAKRPEVVEVEADHATPLPATTQGTIQSMVNGVDWNVERIGAERAWNELTTNGSGIVVANIDTGVDHTHPALATSYRGQRVDGTTNHDYNWFDATGVCPAGTPCDNNGHGTHTMGTMVGREPNGSNQIGVAPGARWIAAKGCGTSTCPDAHLLAAGQWILAPTDSSGRNPRPDLAPDVVNNSWGNNQHKDWYNSIVAAWVAAGIFPAFAAGNAGPNCATAGSPGDYSDSYSSGATDINNQIAEFSSRGGAANPDIKPNISAPGVDIRSSVPGGGYASYNGTSMASPHTAGAVALLWSTAPALIGDVAATRELLDRTAVDSPDTACGGAPNDNSVFGEGRLDIQAALRAAPRKAGMLVGYAYDTTDNAPAGDVTITITGQARRTISTGRDGTLRLDRILPGEYAYTATVFGYQPINGTFTIRENQTSTLTLRLSRLPSAVVTGVVRTDAGDVVPRAEVVAAGTPVSAVADASGQYRLRLPTGGYELRFQSPGERCLSGGTATLTLTADTTLDLTTPRRRDGFGHTCRILGDAGYVAGTDRSTLTGDDASVELALPFPVKLYGTAYDKAWISTNGMISFAGPNPSFSNVALPGFGTPSATVLPFWDDLVVDARAAVYTTVADGRLVVEWRDVTPYSYRDERLSFSATITAEGAVTFGYRPGSGNAASAGASATIGLTHADPTVAFQYAYNTPVVTPGLGLAFQPPGQG